jgi:hypothetical protein
VASGKTFTDGACGAVAINVLVIRRFVLEVFCHEAQIDGVSSPTKMPNVGQDARNFGIRNTQQSSLHSTVNPVKQATLHNVTGVTMVAKCVRNQNHRHLRPDQLPKASACPNAWHS